MNDANARILSSVITKEAPYASVTTILSDHSLEFHVHNTFLSERHAIKAFRHYLFRHNTKLFRTIRTYLHDYIS